MFIRRLEQFKPTKENLDELLQTYYAVGYILFLKKAEYEENKAKNEEETTET